MPNPYVAGGILGLVLGLGYLIYTAWNERPHNYKYDPGNHGQGDFTPGPGYDTRSEWDDERRRNKSRQRQRKSAYSNDQKPQCVICQDTLEVKTTIQLKCRHKFHELCIKRWFEEGPSKICPTCRQPA